MATLAIKGHSKRGSEVIEILEMLGGKNDNHCCGGFLNSIYFINNYGYIESCDRMQHLDYLQFTLEGFLEKFPYKVGDRVLYKIYGIYSKIKSMLWNKEKEQVFYRLESNKLFVATADELKPRKEETMETIKIDIPKGYEFAGVDDNAQQVVFEKIGSQYPKDYEECCKVLNTYCTMPSRPGYKEGLIAKFQELLICRDAYWKIAGDEMGLGKLWKPDFTNDDEERYSIYTLANKVEKDFCGVGDVNMILVFPTEEMRDTFFDNFKDLIEQCKELL